MPESKKLIVFVVYRRNKKNRHGVATDFYAFTEEGFIPVGNDEQGKSLAEECCPIKNIDQSQISQPLFTLKHCHLGQSYAAHLGRVYGVSGLGYDCEPCLRVKRDLLNPETAVYCWDAIHKCWTSLPPMNFGRCLCDIHVLQGKLYVTAPIFSRRKDTAFIERFDESTGRWAVLPYPPHYVKLHLQCFLSAAIQSKGFILFGSKACEFFYAYTPPNSWRLMDNLRCDPIILFGQPLYSLTVTEDHVLWLNGHDGLTVVGFDHNDGHYFEIGLVCEGVLPVRSLLGFPRLVYAGNGVLALVWTDVDCVQGPNGLVHVIHCSRFSIYSDNGHPVLVKHVSHQTCVGPKFMQALVDAFSVDLDVPFGSPSNY